MTPIKDFAVSSAATGFDEFLKVLNEQNGTRWKGNKMFYGIVDNCAWTSSKKWGKELTPLEAIALLTGKQLESQPEIVPSQKEDERQTIEDVLIDSQVLILESQVDAEIEKNKHLQNQLKEAKGFLIKFVSYLEDENMYPSIYKQINQFLTRNK